MSGRGAGRKTPAPPQSDCVELKLYLGGEIDGTRELPQSDCVELKWRRLKYSGSSSVASIGLCGIEIVVAGVAGDEQLGPQSDCVELK